MRVKLFGTLGGLLAATGLGLAQPPAPATLPPTANEGSTPVTSAPVKAPAGLAQAPTTILDGTCGTGCGPTCGTAGCGPTDRGVWAFAEYLVWWVRPGPVSVPLVTSTAPGVNLGTNFAAGGLADPRAFVLFGNNELRYGTFNGGRLTSGMWLNDDRTVGTEGTFWYLEQRSERFEAASNAAGVPALALPFNSVTPGFPGETSGVFAGPFGRVNLQGAVGIASTSQLWGTDTNLLVNAWRSACGDWRLDGILGVKYLNLEEDLNIFATTFGPGGGATLDQFGTANRFYGGQLGARLSGRWERLGFLGVAKLALGSTHQINNIQGATVMGGAVLPGGFYALPTNAGRTTSDRFGLVPEIGVNLFYHLTDHVALTAGYNWLYWTNVLRPGDQIDRNINTNRAPAFGGDGRGVGILAPSRLDRETDFWAHGLSAGLAFTF